MNSISNSSSENYTTNPKYVLEGVSVCLFTINVLMMVFTITGNIVVITAYQKSNILSSNVSNLYICSLAFADLLVGFVAYPLSAWGHLTDSGFVPTYTWQVNKYWCFTKLYFWVLPLSLSLHHIFIIGLDRCIATHWPLRYQGTCTKHIAYLALVYVWVAPFVMGLVKFLPQVNVWVPGAICRPMYVLTSFSTIYALIGIVSTCILYSYIGYAAWKQAKRITHENSSVNPNVLNLKLAKTMMLIVGLLVLFYTPCLILFAVKTSSTSVLLDCLKRLATSSCVWVSAVNPIIYAYKCKDFRQQIKKIFLNCSCSRRDTDLPTTSESNNAVITIASRKLTQPKGLRDSKVSRETFTTEA